MSGIRVRGQLIPYDDKKYNSVFHNQGFQFDITSLKVFQSGFLYNIPGKDYTPTLGKTILGTKECVFKLFAQYYGNIRICLKGTKSEQEGALKILQEVDDSICLMLYLEDIEEKLANNRFASIVYLPCDGMMFEEDLDEYEFNFLDDNEFEIVDARELDVESIKRSNNERY